ncbi:hypothetical protein ACTJJ0_20015 [Chitinophaga sp. 22321]|uniref:Beta-lactamase-inhibitor-like, PepSY-like n=1 Tax=Chitinophaga hostae TaxID=2831022 RepID=A0ABS5IXD8_9BACT|nr:hypothetical protein [Chitinophaga hostae]MBS0027535.1 hypothetical protein [Chitinophaga hostae]
MKRVILSIAFSIAAIVTYAQSGSPAIAMNRKEIRKERREQKITLRALEGKDISDVSKQQFAIDFGNLDNVTWSRDLYYDRADFTDDNGRHVSAFYDGEGALVGTTRPATFDELPAAGKKDIMKHYTGYENAPVIFFDDNEANETDMILYGTQFEDADNYFIELKDKKGNPVVLRVDMAGEVSYFSEMHQ